MKFSVVDKIFRLVLGVLGVFIYGSELLKNNSLEIVCGIVGTILLVTLLFEFCPLYYALGMKKTNKGRKKDRFY